MEVTKRRALFQGMYSVLKDANAKCGFNVGFVTCPCCGFPTSVEPPASWDICYICWWEDDGQDDAPGTPDRLASNLVLGGPNSTLSLDQARSNFVKYGWMFSPEMRDLSKSMYNSIRPDIQAEFQKILLGDSDILASY